ncbi:MAG: hypothetical protein OJJ21_18800 [Ferrovibrio sp.]|uniref:hypothetical protein n=1 Tax=Ferrovibrio sp. TaxID=1917215 RepID=UPI002634DB11|nr:hypothetical protein [Ferrovibrio sp.]MCW0235657.1 hypothetical protein [Ferrovibrio sp.]
MVSQTIDFLDSPDECEAVSFAEALQLGAECAAWAYDEAFTDPRQAGPALDRIYDIMQRLRHLSLSCGHMRAAGICEKVCLLIDMAASDLLRSLRDELGALRRIVIAAMQGNIGAVLCHA